MLKESFKHGIHGIPENVSESDAAVFRSRILNAMSDIKHAINHDTTIIIASSKNIQSQTNKENKDNDNFDVSVKAEQYVSQSPLYSFDQLIVSDETAKRLISAVELVNVEHKVFEEWGLREIEPFPRTALNFFGKPGTGKTLAAHAIANYVNRPILIGSYAEIESKFHGDGPKNVKAFFHAAERDNALLFIDEADSLLSKRLTNVTQGSEQAINSMRSQLLICMEQFRGIVIFSTNLVENYDKAFESRVKNIEFSMPDYSARKKIWKRHLVKSLKVQDQLDINFLAEIDDVCGRDIKNAVIDASVSAALRGDNYVHFDDFVYAIDKIKSSRVNNSKNNLSDNQIKVIEKKVRMRLKKGIKRKKNAYNADITTQK